MGRYKTEDVRCWDYRLYDRREFIEKTTVVETVREGLHLGRTTFESGI